jgi:hypothetical protein
LSQEPSDHAVDKAGATGKAGIEALLTAQAIGGFHVGVIAPSLRFHDMRVG